MPVVVNLKWSMVNGRGGGGIMCPASGIGCWNSTSYRLTGARRRSCVVVKSIIVSKNPGGESFEANILVEVVRGNLHQVVGSVRVNPVRQRLEVGC